MPNRGRLIRRAAIVVGLLYLLGAAVVEFLGASQILLVYLALAGILVLASVFSWRSVPSRDEAERGYWQMTGQRFRDPSTGRTMEVRRNPVTGQRDYIVVDE